MIITEKQKELVKKYLKKSYTDIDLLLTELDDKITEIGFDENYDINEEGILLQRLYDDQIGRASCRERV